MNAPTTFNQRSDLYSRANRTHHGRSGARRPPVAETVEPLSFGTLVQPSPIYA